MCSRRLDERRFRTRTHGDLHECHDRDIPRGRGPRQQAHPGPARPSCEPLSNAPHNWRGRRGCQKRVLYTAVEWTQKDWKILVEESVLPEDLHWAMRVELRWPWTSYVGEPTCNRSDMHLTE